MRTLLVVPLLAVALAVASAQNGRRRLCAGQRASAARSDLLLPINYCGCQQQCYTVMKTCKEVVYEKQNYTCYKTVYENGLRAADDRLREVRRGNRLSQLRVHGLQAGLGNQSPAFATTRSASRSGKPRPAKSATPSASRSGKPRPANICYTVCKPVLRNPECHYTVCKPSTRPRPARFATPSASRSTRPRPANLLHRAASRSTRPRPATLLYGLQAVYETRSATTRSASRLRDEDPRDLLHRLQAGLRNEDPRDLLHRLQAGLRNQDSQHLLHRLQAGLRDPRVPLHGLQAGLRDEDPRDLLHRLQAGLRNQDPRICYTVCKPVYETKTCNICYTVCKPVYETCEREVCYTVCKPVHYTKTIQVCCGHWECHVTECPGPVDDQVLPGARLLELGSLLLPLHLSSGLLPAGPSAMPADQGVPSLLGAGSAGRTIDCVKYVQETVTKQCPYTVCHMVSEQREDLHLHGLPHGAEAPREDLLLSGLPHGCQNSA